MITQTLNIQCAKCGGITKTNNAEDKKNAVFVVTLFNKSPHLNCLMYTCGVCGESYKVNMKIEKI